MSEILVGEYLFHRLKHVGVNTVFGVPGGEFSIMQSWNLLSCPLSGDQLKGLLNSDVFSLARF